MQYPKKPQDYQSYRYLDYVEKEISACVKNYPNLKRSFGPFRLSNNEQKLFLRLQGTIPIVYNQRNYNLPLSIYFSPDYPYSAPFVYLEPAPNMRINKTAHVENTGLVVHNSLKNWSYPNNCQLLKILSILCADFGREPPLYQCGPAHAATNTFNNFNPINQVNSAHAVAASPQSEPQSGSSRNIPPQQPHFNPPPLGPQNFPQPKFNHDNNFNKLKNIATDKLIEFKSKIDHELNISEVLRKGLNEISLKSREIDSDLKRLNSYIEELRKINSAIGGQILEKEELTKKMPALENSLIPYSNVDKDLLLALSDDEAAQDIISILGLALQQKVINPDEYLREIGMIANKQFKDRAMSIRIIEYLSSFPDK